MKVEESLTPSNKKLNKLTNKLFKKIVRRL